MFEDFFDYFAVFDGGNDSDFTLASLAIRDVDVEDPL